MSDTSIPGFPASLTAGNAYTLVPAADLDGCLFVAEDGQLAGFISRGPGLCATDAGHWTAGIDLGRLGFRWRATLSGEDGLVAWSKPRSVALHRHLLITRDNREARLRTRYSDRWEVTLRSGLLARLTVHASIAQRTPFTEADEAGPLGLVEIENAPLAPRQRDLLIMLALVVIRGDDRSSPRPLRLMPVTPPGPS